jgi:prepilin-type N-terminal cleavage/methylation domain-containing protein
VSLTYFYFEKTLLTTHFRQVGFTLLELIIALALSTLIMLMLVVGMNTVVDDWSRSRSHLDDSLDKVLVLLQIERALAGAFPYTYRDNDQEGCFNNKCTFFEGEEEKIAWVSTVSPGRQPGFTAWQLSPSEKETGLEIRTVPAFASDPTERLEKAESVTALEGYKLSFEYLYVDERLKTDTKWLKKWSAKKLRGLPWAVRILLESETNPTEQSMEVIATILANGDPIKP